MPDAKYYRLGLNQPAGSPTARRAAEMAAAINRESGGEFRLDVFPESRLGPDPKMFADLRAGALEFFMAGATLGEVAPTSALPLLPFAFTESKVVFAALDGALGDRIRNELAQNGLHAFRRCWQNGFHHLTTSVRPIRMPMISPGSNSAARVGRSPPISSRALAPRPAWCRSAACTRH